MRTDAERIALLHQRAQKLKDEKMLKIWGSLSAGIFVVLLAVIVKIDTPLQSILYSGYTGSSLLGEEAGAYVLVAVISFVAAVCITLYCIHRRKG